MVNSPLIRPYFLGGGGTGGVPLGSHDIGVVILLFSYKLELPPTQDASHHQDDAPFLGSGIPT